MASLRYDLLPESLRDSVQLYIEYGYEPGSFLTAVICNDLAEACARADEKNRYLLFDIVKWFYNEAPAPCWHSPKRMKAWMQQQRGPTLAEET